MRKFSDGEIVYAKRYMQHPFKMMVIEAEQCLKGWRYKLAFLKKNNEPDKRRIHLLEFEENIEKYGKD